MCSFVLPHLSRSSALSATLPLAPVFPLWLLLLLHVHTCATGRTFCGCCCCCHLSVLVSVRLSVNTSERGNQQQKWSSQWEPPPFCVFCFLSFSLFFFSCSLRFYSCPLLTPVSLASHWLASLLSNSFRHLPSMPPPSSDMVVPLARQCLLLLSFTVTVIGLMIELNAAVGCQ